MAPSSILTPELRILVDKFVDRLKRREVLLAYDTALETAHFLMRIILAARWSSPDQLIALLRQVGLRVAKAQMHEFTAGNVVRRVLALVRDEIELSEGDNLRESMLSLLSTAPQKLQQPRVKVKLLDLRSLVIQSTRDLVDEITNVNDQLQEALVDLLHDGEVLLVPAVLYTVLQWLIKAAAKCRFTVLVMENYPNDIDNAQRFARTLADKNIETVVVPDLAVFALMLRVGKVIVGARTVFANGGCATAAGVAGVCECALQFKTPVVMVAGLFKLLPTYPYSRDSLIEVGSLGSVVDYANLGMVSNADVTNPLYDYVPPDHIDLCVTNVYVPRVCAAC